LARFRHASGWLQQGAKSNMEVTLRDAGDSTLH
jgi:hypothetical protein